MKMAVNGLVVPAPDEGMTELPAGPGVFETLLVREGAAVFFDEHWARFAAGCEGQAFDLPAPSAEVRRLAWSLAMENAVRTGVLRFAAWPGKDRVEWWVEIGGPRVHMGKSHFTVGLGKALPAVTTDRKFKHLNRGPWLLALNAARSAGWDEAILPDEAGRIVEGCVSNLLFVRDGCLHTPAIEVGPLPGIMRDRVLALARELRWNVKEGSYLISDLEQASELWLSNSLIGLRPATFSSACRLDDALPMLRRFRAEWGRKYGWDPVVVAPLA